MTLERAIRELHSHITVTVEFTLTPRGRVHWEKTVSGEDFLDGPWEKVTSGTERTYKKARKAAWG